MSKEDLKRQLRQLLEEKDVTAAVELANSWATGRYDEVMENFVELRSVKGGKQDNGSWY